MTNAITLVKMQELGKGAWSSIIELLKRSNPKQKEQIIKAISGLVGFGALLKYYCTII